MALGRLEQVDLRSVWKSEPYDFTPWLAEAENLQFLSECLELPGLELVRTEHPVESFSADIVCKVVDTDQYVLIENQLEKTDHIHIGQILTYAAKFDAKIIVWIAQRFTEAHRAAVDWLNHISGDQYGFFGVEVRAVRIGTSDVAPLFDVVAKPNEWTKPETIATARQADLSAEHQKNIEFWNLVDAALDENGLVQRKIKKEVKGTNLWLPVTSDGSVYIVCYRAMSGKPRVGAYLAIYGEAMPFYSNALQTIDISGLPEDLIDGRWGQNDKGTVASFNASSFPIEGQDQSAVVDWIVRRVNALASAFMEPARQAQEQKPQNF